MTAFGDCWGFVGSFQDISARLIAELSIALILCHLCWFSSSFWVKLEVWISAYKAWNGLDWVVSSIAFVHMSLWGGCSPEALLCVSDMSKVTWKSTISESLLYTNTVSNDSNKFFLTAVFPSRAKVVLFHRFFGEETNVVMKSIGMTVWESQDQFPYLRGSLLGDLGPVSHS